MDAVELAKLFVKYSETKDLLARLESEIQTEVLRLGKTQTIAGVEAKYFDEGVEYDYQSAAKAAKAPKEVIDAHTTMKPSVRWKEVCQEVGADIEAFSSVREARVVVK